MSFLSYTPELLAAFWVTAAVSFLSFAGAMVLGVLGAVGRGSKLVLVRTVGTVYVEVIRNTPALVQIFLIYFGLPVIGIRFPAFAAGVIALSINGGAYMTEIIRSGLQAVPPGHVEAARTLGLGRLDTFFSVVLPQAVRIVYPPITNEFIQLILGSSLLSVISLDEMTGVAVIINSQTFETMLTFSVVLILYLILTNLVSYGSGKLGRVMFRSQQQVEVKQSLKSSALRSLVRTGVKRR